MSPEPRTLTSLIDALNFFGILEHALEPDDFAPFGSRARRSYELFRDGYGSSLVRYCQGLGGADKLLLEETLKTAYERLFRAELEEGILK